MTVQADFTPVQVTLTTGTDVITVPNYVLLESELKVIRTRSGTNTTLTLNSHYTVTGEGDEGGCTVTMIGQTAGDTITIYRNMSFKQENDLLDGEKRSGPETEKVYDRLTMQDQQLKEQFDRCIRLPEGEDPGNSGELPDADSRKGKVLTFDPTNGLPTATDFDDIVVITGPAREYGTVSSMQADSTVSALATGQSVLLKGYYTAGDFGQPVPLIIETSTGGVKSYLLADGRYANLYSAVSKAAWFGIKADGSTDDTTNLQAWLNSTAIRHEGMSGTSVYSPFTISGKTDLDVDFKGMTLKNVAKTFNNGSGNITVTDGCIFSGCTNLTFWNLGITNSCDLSNSPNIEKVGAGNIAQINPAVKIDGCTGVSLNGVKIKGVCPHPVSVVDAADLEEAMKDFTLHIHDSDYVRVDALSIEQNAGFGEPFGVSSCQAVEVTNGEMRQRASTSFGQPYSFVKAIDVDQCTISGVVGRTHIDTSFMDVVGSQISISDCHLVETDSAGTTIEGNCTLVDVSFEWNDVIQRKQRGITISNCTSTGKIYKNAGVSGSSSLVNVDEARTYPIEDVVIENCSGYVTGLATTTGSSGGTIAVHPEFTTTARVINCEFIDNLHGPGSSTLGSATEASPFAPKIRYENCLFKYTGTATAQAQLYARDGIVYDNCEFDLGTYDTTNRFTLFDRYTDLVDSSARRGKHREYVGDAVFNNCKLKNGKFYMDCNAKFFGCEFFNAYFLLSDSGSNMSGSRFYWLGGIYEGSTYATPDPFNSGLEYIITNTENADILIEGTRFVGHGSWNASTLYRGRYLIEVDTTVPPRYITLRDFEWTWACIDKDDPTLRGSDTFPMFYVDQTAITDPVDIVLEGIVSRGGVPFQITGGTNAGVQLTIDSATDVSAATEQITSTGHGIADGEPLRWLQDPASGSALPTPFVEWRPYKAIYVDANTVQVENKQGSRINITAVGTGSAHILLKAWVDILCSGCLFTNDQDDGAEDDEMIDTATTSLDISRIRMNNTTWSAGMATNWTNENAHLHTATKVGDQTL